MNQSFINDSKLFKKEILCTRIVINLLLKALLQQFKNANSDLNILTLARQGRISNFICIRRSHSNKW